MYGAMKICRDLPAGKRVVMLLPDSIRNYMSKFINDDWMYECGFITEEENTESFRPKLVPNNKWGKEYTIKDLHLKDAFMVNHDILIKDVIDLIQGFSFDQFPV
jgi:cystathionine beta-synthase